MKGENALILKKSDAMMFFAGLGHEMRLIAPKTHFGGDVMFDVVEAPSEIVWDYGHDVYPPKRFLLPHYEDMFRYDCRGAGDPSTSSSNAPTSIEIENAAEAPPQAIIGIRSCDVKAIRFQEKFYSWPIVDPLYKARSENTVLFSLVCNEPPKKECFCICCDAGPYLEADYDVQLTDLGDRFLFEVGSEKGRKAIESGAYLLADAKPNDFTERRKIELHADSLFETVSYIAKAINYITADEAPDLVWEELGSTCFRCGACTNLCPVCTCYTVEDIAQNNGSFMRCRSWDSCQYSGFTREASGHNPRPTKGSRLYRRMYHKASYQYIMRDGTHGCVGCGRCITACLTKLGLPNVIKRIRRSMHDYIKPEDQVHSEGVR